MVSTDHSVRMAPHFTAPYSFADLTCHEFGAQRQYLAYIKHSYRDGVLNQERKITYNGTLATISEYFFNHVANDGLIPCLPQPIA